MAPLFYGPNLCGVSVVKMDGREVYASNDQGTAAQACMVDAAFLKTLPSYGGARALANLPGVAPEHQTCGGKVSMPVLGVLHNVPMRIQYSTAAPEEVHDVTAPRVFVVQGLPVPVHVSNGLVNPRTIVLSTRSVPKFEAKTFGERYMSNPYWASDVQWLNISPLSAGRPQSYSDSESDSESEVDAYDSPEDFTEQPRNSQGAAREQPRNNQGAAREQPGNSQPTTNLPSETSEARPTRVPDDEHLIAMLSMADEFEAACLQQPEAPVPPALCNMTYAMLRGGASRAGPQTPRADPDKPLSRTGSGPLGSPRLLGPRDDAFDEFTCEEKLDRNLLIRLLTDLKRDADRREACLRLLKEAQLRGIGKSTVVDAWLKKLERCAKLEGTAKDLLDILPTACGHRGDCECGCVVQTIRYGHRLETRGRLFATCPSGARIRAPGGDVDKRPLNLQGMPGDLRPLLVGEFAHDIDCENSEFRLLRSLAVKYTTLQAIPTIDRYVQDRDAILGLISRSHGVDRSAAKRLPNIVASGGCYSTWLRQQTRESGSRENSLQPESEVSSFCTRLQEEIRSLRDVLLAEDDFAWLEKERRRLREKGRAAGAIVGQLMPIIIRHSEATVLRILHETFCKHGWIVRAKVFDGLIAERGPDAEIGLAAVMRLAVLECANQGWLVQLVEKPLHGEQHRAVPSIAPARKAAEEAFLWLLESNESDECDDESNECDDECVWNHLGLSELGFAKARFPIGSIVRVMKLTGEDAPARIEAFLESNESLNPSSATWGCAGKIRVRYEDGSKDCVSPWVLDGPSADWEYYNLDDYDPLEYHPGIECAQTHQKPIVGIRYLEKSSGRSFCELAHRNRERDDTYQFKQYEPLRSPWRNSRNGPWSSYELVATLKLELKVGQEVWATADIVDVWDNNTVRAPAHCSGVVIDPTPLEVPTSAPDILNILVSWRKTGWEEIQPVPLLKLSTCPPAVGGFTVGQRVRPARDIVTDLPRGSVPTDAEGVVVGYEQDQLPHKFLRVSWSHPAWPSQRVISVDLRHKPPFT